MSNVNTMRATHIAASQRRQRHEESPLPPSTGSDSPDRPKFELDRFNPRRRARGAEAASVRVTWPDGAEEVLWMSERDLKANMKEWGACDGLLNALNAYRQNAEVRHGGPDGNE